MLADMIDAACLRWQLELYTNETDWIVFTCTLLRFDVLHKNIFDRLCDPQQWYRTHGRTYLYSGPVSA